VKEGGKKKTSLEHLDLGDERGDVEPRKDGSPLRLSHASSVGRWSGEWECIDHITMTFGSTRDNGHRKKRKAEDPNITCCENKHNSSNHAQKSARLRYCKSLKTEDLNRSSVGRQKPGKEERDRQSRSIRKSIDLHLYSWR